MLSLSLCLFRFTLTCNVFSFDGKPMPSSSLEINTKYTHLSLKCSLSI